MQATLKHEHGVVYYPAPQGGLSSGDVVEVPDGRAGIVQGLKGFEQGELAAVRVSGLVEVNSASATEFAAGAIAEFDEGEGLAVASGDFELGVVVAAKASGQTSVLVDLNQAPLSEVVNPAG